MKTIYSRVSTNTVVDGVGDIHMYLGQLTHRLFEETPQTKTLLHTLTSVYFSEVPCAIPYFVGCLLELYGAIMS